jgi:phage terminase large subunit GpA-like protein
MNSLSTHKPTRTPGTNPPAGLRSAWQLDCDIFAEAIRPDPDLTISEWADAHRILSPESSAEHGPWRTERVPYTREIMDALSPTDATTEVTFVAGTQVAKTETGNNFIGYIIDVAPGPAMMVYPTSNTGKRTSKTRLAKMIEAMPGLRGKISDKQRDSANSASLKQFPGGVLVIAGANSAAELKSQPVRYIFEDEVDEYPDDVDGQGPADELAEKRADTFERNKKIYRTSTTTIKGRSKIWRHWEKSDKRRYHVPCPHCQERQVLLWTQMRWETRKRWEVVRSDDGVIVEVPEGTEGAKPRDTGEVIEVWYECGHCSARIEEHHKGWMLERGAWIAEAPWVKGHAGFHLSALYSPLGWYSWTTAVKKRLEADKDPSKKLLKTWTNTVAAEPYADEGEKVSDLTLKERALGDAQRPAYRLGTVPRFALLLSAAVDVQHDRLEVAVKGWGREKESCLVDYQVIHGNTETAAPWDALDEYHGKKFPHASGAELRITAMAVDSGYRTQTVYDWCRLRSHRHIFPVKGQTTPGKRILGIATAQDIEHNGRKIAGGVALYPVGSDTAKEEIYARLKIERAGPGFLHFPIGLPDDYFKGLVAESRITKYVKGFLRHVWEKTETERNEPLDLEVYAYAAAIYAGLNRVNWDRLEASLIATAGDLFVQAQAAAPAGAEGQPSAPEPQPAAPASAAAAPTDTRVQTSAPAARPPRSGFVHRWRQ